MTGEIRAEIQRHGPVPFERFMELALYGAEGFYTRADGGSAGRRGDFITSPEVGPLFGAVIARYLDAEWDRIGRPDPFTVVDAGAGPGTLARAVLAAAPRCADALRYVAVEISTPQRARHPDGVESVASMPESVFDGVVIANELLDNLPFRLAVFDNGWREAFVVVGADGRFVEVLSAPLDPVPPQLPATGAFGSRAPLIARAAAFVDQARSVVRTGSVLAIDYATPITAMLAGRPYRDWLRTYRGNERGDHYLAAPGSQDITVDVPIDQLPEPDAVRTQAQFLQLWGIEEMVAEGKRIWEEQAARPGLEAMKMRSRISESEALLDPAGLGGFLVAEWRNGDTVGSPR
jgi:SAM-dependent MidA family methyltransferase